MFNRTIIDFWVITLLPSDFIVEPRLKGPTDCSIMKVRSHLCPLFVQPLIMPLQGFGFLPLPKVLVPYQTHNRSWGQAFLIGVVYRSFFLQKVTNTSGGQAFLIGVVYRR